MVLALLAVPRSAVLSSISPAAPTPAGLTATPDSHKLPLSFVPNAGQTDPAVRFEVRGMGGTLFFKANEVVLSLPTEPQSPARQDTTLAPLDHLREERLAAAEAAAPPTVVRLRFEDANPTPEVTGIERLPGIVNYFIGNDPAKWHTNLPTYGGIAYRQLYPGIDLRYDGTEGVLKGTYIVAPGADPTRIRWRYEGATSVRVDEATGDLLIDLPSAAGAGGRDEGHTLTEQAPTAWQEINGQRVPVATRYAIADDGTIGFALSNYDPTWPLMIDPTLVYSTYLGGTDMDEGNDIAVDSAGNVYVTGSTHASDFSRPAAYDVLVTKLNADGSALVYSTFLGAGSGHGIAADSAGNAYVTGSAWSTFDFPTASPLQATLDSPPYAFVAKLNADGSALVYSTFLGGGNGDGIALDSDGNAYVTGCTTSSDFPTANPLDGSLGGYIDAFVAKLNTDGSGLIYSTYLGGSDYEYGHSIAVDSAGNAYIAGATQSTDFPTASPLQTTLGGSTDAFVAKLNTDGNAFVYSTYLGGSEHDLGEGIAVDSEGNAYITGWTWSTDFPTVDPLQGSFAGVADAFVAKLNEDGGALVYSTYLGGSGRDEGEGIAVDSAGNAYITGDTNSSDFPIANPVQATCRGEDAFVAKLSGDGSALVYSTYLGGSGSDYGRGIAVDSEGNAYVTGSTLSSDFPTANPVQGSRSGVTDAFVAKIHIPLPVVESITLTPPSPVKAEMVEFEVIFSKQMNSAITPTVTIGMDSPYTDYAIAPKMGANYTNGYLNSDTTKWYGTYTLTDTMGDGTYHISIAGAEGLLGKKMATDTSEALVLDTVAPSGSLSIDEGAAYANTTSVTLTTSITDTTSGVAQMQFSNDGVSYAPWETYASTKPWMLLSGDGLKTVYVKYKDYADNVSIPCTDTITLDTTAPAGSISINEGATYATSRSVNLTLSASDETSGVSQMRFSNDGSNWNDWEDYNTSKAWTLSTGDGTKTVYVHYKDNAGNVGTYTDTIILDTAPPSSSVADLPTYHTTLFSSVSWSGFDATSGIASYDVQFRDGTGVSWEDWQTRTTATSTAFVGVDGHTYYFQSRARDNAGNVEDYPGGDGDTHTTVDVTAPNGTINIEGDASYTNSTVVNLTLSASDATSGVSQMCFSNDGTSYDSWQGYATSASWVLSTGDGTKTVYVRYEDNADNVSSPFSDTIVLDTAAPSGSVSINDGASYANTTSVVLTLSADDALSGVSQMSFSNNNTNWSEWEAYGTGKSWTLSSGDGIKTVYVRYKDTAGNVATSSNTIILDTTPPSSTVDTLATYQADTSFVVSWSGSDALAGLASYDVQFRDGMGVSWEDWQTGVVATSTAFVGEDGHTYYFQSRARDNAGNVEGYPGGDGDTYTTVDVTPPSGSILVNDGAIDTTSIDVILKPSASDSVSGVSQMSFSNDGGNYSDWESYGSSKSWTLTSGDGLKTVYVRYKDNAGNISSVCTDTINLDTTVQPEYGLSINEGALFTNKITVTLTLPANPSTAQMMVGNDGGFAGAQWEPYATHREWQITQYGAYVIPRIVYAKYKDTAGVISSVYQDDIILDVTAPNSSITNLSRIGASSSARVSALSSSTVPVAVGWEGSDDVSGVRWYDIQYKRGSAATWTDWLTGTTQTSATFNATPGYTYYFQSRAEDHAGNWEDYPGGDGDAHICIQVFAYRVYLPLLAKLGITAKVTRNMGESVSAPHILEYRSRDWPNMWGWRRLTCDFYPNAKLGSYVTR